MALFIPSESGSSPSILTNNQTDMNQFMDTVYANGVEVSRLFGNGQLVWDGRHWTNASVVAGERVFEFLGTTFRRTGYLLFDVGSSGQNLNGPYSPRIDAGGYGGSHDGFSWIAAYTDHAVVNNDYVSYLRFLGFNSGWPTSRVPFSELSLKHTPPIGGTIQNNVIVNNNWAVRAPDQVVLQQSSGAAYELILAWSESPSGLAYPTTLPFSFGSHTGALAGVSDRFYLDLKPRGEFM